jgi:chaperone required for assembly of F1-ATPase
MRDLFEDIFSGPSLDPPAAARRSMQPQLRRRCSERAGIEQENGANFRVVLDGRPVRTPSRRALAAPGLALAEALAVEWEQQREVIDPASMPLTRLANSITDGVADAACAVSAEIERYIASDLILYRASGPDGLVARQAGAWDPVLAWARDALGARFTPAHGLTYHAQPPRALTLAKAAIPRHPWRLGAVHAITTLTGSALIALAMAGGALSVETAWTAAHVDEDWNMDQWGRDELALERRRHHFAEMRAAAFVLQSI